MFSGRALSLMWEQGVFIETRPGYAICMEGSLRTRCSLKRSMPTRPTCTACSVRRSRAARRSTYFWWSLMGWIGRRVGPHRSTRAAGWLIRRGLAPGWCFRITIGARRTLDTLSVPPWAMKSIPMSMRRWIRRPRRNSAGTIRGSEAELLGNPRATFSI
jgi:hypothetical protein